jgi:hypothetical protein
MAILAWRTVTITKIDRSPLDLQAAILEASSEDLKDIQLWLKQRMDTDWIKAHNKGLLP